MIIFYLKEAFNSFKTAKLATIITASSIILGILLSTASLGAIILSEKLNKKLSSNIEVNLYLKDVISQDEIKQIEAELKKNNEIVHVNFLSKEDAKRKFILDTGEDFSSLLTINPLPASYSIKLSSRLLKDIERIKELTAKLKEIPGVDDVVFDFQYIVKILEMLSSTKFFLYFFSVFFIGLSIYLVYFTNRLIIENKVEKYKIMKLVGAKLSAIKIPIIIYSLVVTFFSSIICLLILNFFIYFVNTIYYNTLLKNNIIYIFAFQVLAGLLLGSMGIMVTVNRLNKSLNEN
ncbi:MAG: permease-like cell division protein FtsX [Ignavibacteria bacterium]|jgi:cell division transport system permease protein